MALSLDEAVAKMNTFSNSAPRDKVNAFVDIAAELTDSKLGYYAVMNQAEDELTMLGWSRNAMDACAMMDKPIVYPLEATGLLGRLCSRETTGHHKTTIRNAKRKPAKAIQMVTSSWFIMPTYQSGKALTSLECWE